MAAPGYPDQPLKGVPIEGDLSYQTASSYFLHAGTLKTNTNGWVTNGGRVLCSIGIGSTFQESIQNAYSQAARVRWKNQLMRTDIGAKITSSISG